MKLSPEITWLTVLIRALCATHQNPQLLRETFAQFAEEKIAQSLRHEEDEGWMQHLLKCRAGYEAWIPAPEQH